MLPYWNTLLRIERRDPDCIETVPKPSLGVTYLSVFQYGHTQFGIEPKSFSLRTHDFPLWDIACPNAYWPVSRYSHAVACCHIETHYRPSIMPGRYTRLWRVLPFAIMRFNMVSYRYRSRLLSDFSAILFQLFSVTSGFSLSLSTDTNHIETHYRISVLSLGKFTIYCNGLAFYSPADSLGIFPIMCFNMERDKRIELLTEDWKSAVLPLN